LIGCQNGIAKKILSYNQTGAKVHGLVALISAEEFWVHNQLTKQALTMKKKLVQIQIISQ
jgi:hypothetical protein